MEDYVFTRDASSKHTNEVFIKVENEDYFNVNDAPEEINHQEVQKSKLTLYEDGRSPSTSSWFKDGICGSINYTEYHKSEMKLHAKEPEIKQESDEGDLENEEEWSHNGVTSCDEDLKRGKEIEEGETNTEDRDDLVESKEGLVVEREEEVFVSCHFCGEKRKTKKQLREHVYRVHLSVLIAQEKGECERNTLKCTICEKSFEFKSHLMRHLNDHSMKKAYKCNYCDFRTSSSSNLKTHMYKHSGARPFKCGLCEYSTGDKSSLRTHMFTHTGEKRFKCDMCGYRTSRQSNLKTHIRIHTKEKPHKCNICGFSTADRSCLTRHIRIHTGVKPLKCDLCEYRALRVSHLKKHLNTHKKTPL